jgi:hypothetical protein
MQIVYLNGSKLQLTWREMLGQFRHPLFVGLVLVVSTVIILVGPYDDLLMFGPLKLGIFYANGFGSFIAILILCLYLCHRWRWNAYSLVTVFVSVLGSTAWGMIVALLLGARMPPVSDLALVIGFNLVFAYAGEILHAGFVMPRALADMRGTSPQAILAEFLVSEEGTLKESFPGPLPVVTRPAASPSVASPPPSDAGRHIGESVTIFGQPFRLAEIMSIEAEEHYICLTLHSGARHLLRGRIADAIAAMPPGRGLQIHRSYWVASAALARFSQGRSAAQITLVDGRVLPVARQRIPQVREWAAAHLQTD